MLSHANLIADAAGTAALLEDFQPGNRHISYLPLAHIYERNNMTVGLLALGKKARLAPPTPRERALSFCDHLGGFSGGLLVQRWWGGWARTLARP
jgi:hypothetical protein